jgi:hypothetical protein
MELIIFIEESSLSVAIKNNNELETVKIKGESAFHYSSIGEVVPFLTDYLKQSLRINSFSNTSITIFSFELNDNIKGHFYGGFNEADIEFHPMDLILFYLRIFNEYKIEKVQKYYLLLEEENKQLKKENTAYERKIQTLHTDIIKAKKKNESYESKIKEYKDIFNAKELLKREIVFIDSNEQQLTMHVQNKVYVHKGKIIANYKRTKGTNIIPILLYADMHSESEIISPFEGYLFWLQPNPQKNILVKEFGYKNKRGNVAAAVISNYKEDEYSEIIKEVKEKLGKYSE